MFERLDETKVLRDPIHGYIHIDLEVIWDLLNSSWFQRLRRIRQLGGSFIVYHCAEHTRFTHSLGVYEIVRRMVTEIPDIRGELSEKERVTVMAAALLHDIGHGPYSHTFESVTNISHELMTCRIIEGDTDVRRILENAAKGLSKDVADVIRHKHKKQLLSQLISSQMDADRFDYLMRDAYFTGTKYGDIDMERILRTLRVKDGQLVVKKSGVYAVESYIMARYHMYWQIYLHPVARSFESIVHKLFQRLKDIDSDDPSLIREFRILTQSDEIALEDFFTLDEYACTYGFICLKKHPDPIIRDLAERVSDRKLFDYEDKSKVTEREIRKSLKERGLDPKYYLVHDEVAQSPYDPYTGENDENVIWVLLKDGRSVELSKASKVVNMLSKGARDDDTKLFYPK